MRGERRLVEVVLSRARDTDFHNNELNEVHAKRGHFYHNAHALYASGWTRQVPFPFPSKNEKEENNYNGSKVTIEVELSFFNPLQAAVDVSAMRLVGGVVRAGRGSKNTSKDSHSHGPN